eukprot:1162105-Pelagomonas_calceolata.AAC.10
MHVPGAARKSCTMRNTSSERPFSGNVPDLLDDVLALRPHIFVSVPRLWNRIYDKVRVLFKGSVIAIGCKRWPAARQSEQLDPSDGQQPGKVSNWMQLGKVSNGMQLGKVSSRELVVASDGQQFGIVGQRGGQQLGKVST